MLLDYVSLVPELEGIVPVVLEHSHDLVTHPLYLQVYTHMEIRVG